MVKILSYIVLKDRHFSGIWDELMAHIGSKTTLRKYLQELIDKDLIRVYETKVGKGRHRVYHEPQMENLNNVRSFISNVRRLIRRNDEKAFYEYLYLSFISSLTALQGKEKIWYIRFTFTFMFLMELVGEVDVDFKKIPPDFFRGVVNIDKLETINILTDFFLKAISP